MSFAMTTPQFRARTKTVTRRFGWWFLKPGDVVMGVERSRGLDRGEPVHRPGQSELDVRGARARPKLASRTLPKPPKLSSGAVVTDFSPRSRSRPGK